MNNRPAKLIATPPWYDPAKRRVVPIDPHNPSYDEHGNWRWHQPHSKSLIIRRATYGAQGWNWLHKGRVLYDVTEILNSRIVGNRLAIPGDYDALFGDPEPACKPKQLIIWFCYRDCGYTFVDQGTQIDNLVAYVKAREEAEHRAEIDYQREAITY